MPDKPNAEQLIKRLQTLENKRATWLALWNDVADYVMPERGPFLGDITPGSERYDKMFDSTAPDALERLAAAMQGELTNPAQQWFGLTARGLPEEMNQSKEVKDWLEEVAEEIMAAYNRSNQPQILHEVFYDLAGFGISTLYQEEEKDETGELNFLAFNLSEVHIAENAQGRIDTIFRKFRYTARQAFEVWGDLLPEKIVRDAKKEPENEHLFLHAVLPTPD